MEKIWKPQLISLVAILVFLTFVLKVDIDEHTTLQHREMCTLMQSELVSSTFGKTTEEIEAKAFFVYDFSHGTQLSEKNAAATLPLASLTKLMTVRLALQKKSIDDFYTIQKDDLVADGSVGFIAGDSYRIRDLISSALIASSNDAAMMLSHSTGVSDNTFVATMNYEAGRLGLSTLNFTNATGLDIDATNTAGAFGSAHDILMLLHEDYVDFPDMLSVSTWPTNTISASNGRAIALKNTNTVIDLLPLLVASKTGYTDIAGGNLAVLWKNQKNELLGAALLGSSENGRFADMVALHDAANTYTQRREIFPNYCK